MKLQTGQPTVEGRYVGFIRSRTSPDWCEPIFATWHGERWHSYDIPLAWIGPVPVVSVAEISLLMGEQEYDL